MADYNLFDIVLVFIVSTGALYGAYKGFVFSLLNFAGKILSAFLAIRFLKSFIEFFNIKESFLKGTIKIVKDYIPLTEEIKSISINNGAVDFTAPYFQENMFAKIMGKNISREIEHLYEVGKDLSLETVGDMMSLILANYIINILSFIALFLILLVGFSLLRTFLIKAVGLSSFATFLDKLLGFVFGAGVNIFVLAFVVGVSFDILNLIALKDSGFLNIYKEMVNDSQLKEYLYYVYGMIINEGTKLL